MFTHVVLKATEGSLRGKEFVLADGMSYVLGRSPDCAISIADPLYTVSRRHCLFDLGSPFLHVHDLGSLNGTYVNGQNIGQRSREERLGETRCENHAERELCEGDKIRVGNHVFEVQFSALLPPCAEEEPRDQKRLWSCDCAALCG